MEKKFLSPGGPIVSLPDWPVYKAYRKSKRESLEKAREKSERGKRIEKATSTISYPEAELFTKPATLHRTAEKLV